MGKGPDWAASLVGRKLKLSSDPAANQPELQQTWNGTIKSSWKRNFMAENEWAAGLVRPANPARTLKRGSSKM